MKTGKFRVRRGWFGKAVLQELYDSPSYIGGHVDSSIRDYRWKDVKFDDLSNIAFIKKELNP